MKERLLICDCSPGLGKLILRRFVSMGIAADCCRGSIASIHRALSAKKYTCILVFAFFPDEKILSLLKDAADSGMTAFAGLYSSSVSDHNEFRRQGAALTFSLPCSLVSLCKSILIRAGSRNTLLSQMEIFLEGTGMPRKLKGFGCLADISVLCLESPERLWGGIMGIYEETAGKLSVNAAQVERAVRNLGDHAAQNGAISRLTEGRLSDRPNNTELICAVCDGFPRR